MKITTKKEEVQVLRNVKFVYIILQTPKSVL